MAKDEKLTSTEIAELFGVVRSTVSNWKSRHEDFPKPLEQYRRTTLYSKSAVQEWYRSKHND